MKTSELFKEYIWLIDLLKTYGGITFEEINEKWVQTEMSGGVDLAHVIRAIHLLAVLHEVVSCNAMFISAKIHNNIGNHNK